MSVHMSSKPADEASRLPAAAWLVLGIVLVADIMDLLDSTITTIAAPTISSSLHGGPGLIKWLGASYALALGVLLVTGGRLGDKYGRRRTFLIGLAGFTAASLACGLAWDPPSIIVARLVQGAFGALLIPQGFGILGAVFPREHIGKAFSAFGPILGLSAVGGPLLAGLLIDANLFGLGWRPMFLINIVLGAAGLAAGLRLLPRDAGDRAVSIDAPGSALLAACMLGLLSGLIQGSTDGWTAAPIAALAAPASTSATPSTPRLSGSGHVCLIAVPGTGIPLPPGVLTAADRACWHQLVALLGTKGMLVARTGTGFVHRNGADLH